MCHDQYDSMAYPNVFNKKIVFRQGTVQHLADSNAIENEFLVLDRESMQKEALYIYLDCLKDKLCEWKLSRDHNIEDTTEQILKIYWALSNTLIGASEKLQGTWRTTWSCKELLPVSLHLQIVILHAMSQYTSNQFF